MRDDICRAAGVELDLGAMNLPDNLVARYGRLLDDACDKMEAIERGGIGNPDEHRQVGHYWLREPQRAPAAVGPAIQAAWNAVQSFAEQPLANQALKNVLWIGIGGSGLGPQMLYDALRVPGQTPAMFFFDNTDPSGFQRVLDDVRQHGGLPATLAVVVSKSGGTRETYNGMEVARRAYEEAGLEFADHAAAITQPGSKLEQQAADWRARLPIWDWVGGRTSLFSAVGLLPAALLRFDTSALLRGAQQMDQATRVRDVLANPALLLATAWYFAVNDRGLANQVVLPYADRLALLSSYLQQLVMESIGKQGHGLSVFGNKGSTDQHSFVQQLREGRADFFASFVRVLCPTTDYEIEPDKTAGDYLAAFQQGTAAALTEAGRPSLNISIERLDEARLGALVALFERTVGYYGAMLGINPYHQPGVEAGKKAADGIMRLQEQVVMRLREAAEPLTVRALAGQFGANPRLVFDLLHRLDCCGRLVQRVGSRSDDCLAEQFAAR